MIGKTTEEQATQGLGAEEPKSVLSVSKKSVDCYECEEAKRRAEKAKNHWIRKQWKPSYYFLAMSASLGYLLLNLFLRHPHGFLYIAFVAAIILFSLCALDLLFKLYQEIFQGFSLYYFKTADGVLHAHLKRPAADFIRNLPMPVIVKIGICGWFRKSKIMFRVEKSQIKFDKRDGSPGKIFVYDLLNEYKGLKIHKARCGEKTLELKSVTLEDRIGDRATLDSVLEIYELLELAKKFTEDNFTSVYNIIHLLDKVRFLREACQFITDERKEKEKELLAAQTETEKYKEIAVIYASYEQVLIDWIAQSRDNPNLGKSKHAQAIKQKLMEHKKAVEKKYGKIF